MIARPPAAAMAPWIRRHGYSDGSPARTVIASTPTHSDTVDAVRMRRSVGSFTPSTIPADTRRTEVAPRSRYIHMVRVLFVLLALGCALPSSALARGTTQDIVGGHAATRDYPYQVLVQPVSGRSH